MKLNSRRYCPGCYDVTYRDRTFRVWSDEYQSRQSGHPMTSSYNTWGIAEITDGIDHYDGYWNHFATKGDCLEVIREACDAQATSTTHTDEAVYTCRICDKRTGGDGESGLELCRRCYDACENEKEHKDGYHDDQDEPGCSFCEDERRRVENHGKMPRIRKGNNNERTN